MSRYLTSAELVKLVDEMRSSAAAVVSHAFDRRQKCVSVIPGFYREKVSLACSEDGNSSPLFTLAGWCVALWKIGRIDLAQTLVDFLQDCIDRLSSNDEHIDVYIISLAEQKQQAYEELFRVEYEETPAELRGDVRERWVHQLRVERATTNRLVRALAREQAQALEKAA